MIKFCVALSFAVQAVSAAKIAAKQDVDMLFGDSGTSLEDLMAAFSMDNLVVNESDNHDVVVDAANPAGKLSVEKEDSVISVAEKSDGDKQTRTLTVEQKPSINEDGSLQESEKQISITNSMGDDGVGLQTKTETEFSSKTQTQPIEQSATEGQQVLSGDEFLNSVFNSFDAAPAQNTSDNQ